MEVRNMKKAQGMSLNVIVVAVIVLVILVVLVLIFSGKLKIFGSKTTETSNQFDATKCVVPGTNNECVYSADDCKSKGGSYVEKAEGFSDCNELLGGGQCCYL
jgi:hypothetical protein